ncbi:hypothetical protein BJ912DRAFT_1050859 [Pholiota molesta]|nr:hypothetical protein BJ912DRAFT_1050859 [Pholiota molesta]
MAVTKNTFTQGHNVGYEDPVVPRCQAICEIPTSSELGTYSTDAALSVNILHEIVEVAQERKCIQDGNSVAVLLLTAAATAAHCAQQCRAVLVTVVRVIPKRKPSKFFQKQNDKFAIKSQTHDLVPNHMTTHDCKWGRDPPRGGKYLK